MKKFLLIVLLFWSSVVFALPFKHVIFLGDSLSDNGNVYQLLLHVVPKSPPYYRGRFSNGPTWAEHLGKYYYHKNYSDYKILAYGGATALFHMPTKHFISTTNLTLLYRGYLAGTGKKNIEDTLFVIWIAGNDYLYFLSEDVDKFTTRVVDAIEWVMKDLIQRGAKNILVLNLPDMSRTPFAQKVDYKDRLYSLGLLHKEKLDQAVQTLQKTHPDRHIVLMDVYDLFLDFLSHPEVYNKKYGAHVKNTTESCWQGGYVLSPVTKEALQQEMKEAVIKQGIKGDSHTDTSKLADMVFSSPALLQAYKVGKMAEAGIFPCSNADDYFFWDEIHPTDVVHTVMAKIIEEKLEKEFQ